MRLFSFLNLIILPIIWLAPLFGAGLIPFFNLKSVSIYTGVLALWEKDSTLAILIGFFVFVMPFLKAVSMLLDAFKMPHLPPKVAYWVARMSMLDIFLIAITIVVIKGVGVGRVEILWGYWAFITYVILGYVIAASKFASNRKTSQLG